MYLVWKLVVSVGEARAVYRHLIGNCLIGTKTLWPALAILFPKVTVRFYILTTYFTYNHIVFNQPEVVHTGDLF